MKILINRIATALDLIEVPYDIGIFTNKITREDAVDLAKNEIVDFLCDPESHYGRMEVKILFEALKAIEALEFYFSIV